MTDPKDTAKNTAEDVTCTAADTGRRVGDIVTDSPEQAAVQGKNIGDYVFDAVETLRENDTVNTIWEKAASVYKAHPTMVKIIAATVISASGSGIVHRSRR